MCSILSIMLSNLCKSLGSSRNRSSMAKKRRTSRGDTRLRILRWCCKMSTKTVFTIHTSAVRFRLTVAACVFFTTDFWPWNRLIDGNAKTGVACFATVGVDVWIFTTGVSNLNRLIGSKNFWELFDAVAMISLSLRDRVIGNTGKKFWEWFDAVAMISLSLRDRLIGNTDKNFWELFDAVARISLSLRDRLIGDADAKTAKSFIINVDGDGCEIILWFYIYFYRGQRPRGAVSAGHSVYRAFWDQKISLGRPPFLQFTCNPIQFTCNPIEIWCYV